MLRLLRNTRSFPITRTFSTMSKKVDHDDLLVFDDSDFEAIDSTVSIDANDADRLGLRSSPVKGQDDIDKVDWVESSPVKPHNRQFEADFEDSWIDSDDSQQQGVNGAETILFKLSQLSHHSSTQDTAQMSGNEVGAQISTPDAISISAPETSSPAYHRTETLNPYACKKHPVPIIQSARDPQSKTSCNPPNPRLKDGLYPSLDSYDARYTQQETHSKPQIDSTTLSGPSSPPSVEQYTGLIKECKAMGEFDPSIIDKKKTGMASLQPLLKRRKLPNRELLLMTQRTTIESMGLLRRMSSLSKEKPKRVEALVLSEEQQHIVDIVKRGRSLFYTGSAGTGKSVLLKSLIKTLKNMYPGQGEVAVTASTGLAAVNIGGITLHSFSGIGLGKEDADSLVKKVRRNRKASQRWKTVRVLIIDEISMISGELFDKLDHIACELRRNDRPFGGIQVICCGDFFQLPPVSKEEEQATFCFESDAWKRSMKLTITLQKVFRQKGDLEFIDMLNDMRLGKVTPQAEAKFRALERPLPENEIEPAELYSTRSEVERANNLRLKSLPDSVHVYNATDGGTLTDQTARLKMLSNFMAPDQLELKKGAQVMMIKNLDESLVNGSLGKVIDFVDKDTYLCYEKISSEGLTEEQIQSEVEKAKAKALEGSTGEDEEVYEGLEESVFDFLRDIKTDDPETRRSIDNKIRLINELKSISKGHKLPLVRFLTPDGQSRVVLVNPETWTVEDEKQTPLVSRTQLPLILAWALSIHKSQGQTLPKVRVNLKRIFEKGQAYVAISRAVSREGLQILNFDQSKVFAHPRVVQFYEELSSAADALNMEQETFEKFEAHPNSKVHHKKYSTRERPQRSNSHRKTNNTMPGAYPQFEDSDDDKIIVGARRSKRSPGITVSPDGQFSEVVSRVQAEDYM